MGHLTVVDLHPGVLQSGAHRTELGRQADDLPLIAGWHDIFGTTIDCGEHHNLLFA